MFRNQLLARLAAAVMVVLGGASSAPARAADYPTKAVTVVVGYAAGGPTDILMRAMAPRLSAQWKRPVIVENRPGANEVIAAQVVSKAPPGHSAAALCGRGVAGAAH